MSRREKLRQEMLEDIKTIARRQMAENGTAAISLSGIARTLEVSQPALYRYYPSRDALVTALIVDGYNDLADFMAAADRREPRDVYRKRLLAAMQANREWALLHPLDFQLLFGNPIPGYHAPEEVTLPAAQRVFAVILTILWEASQAGVLKVNQADGNRLENVSLRVPFQQDGQWAELPQDVAYSGMVGWGLTHGMIMLELFNHTQALLPDPGAFYRQESEALLDRFGIE